MSRRQTLWFFWSPHSLVILSQFGCWSGLFSDLAPILISSSQFSVDLDLGTLFYMIPCFVIHPSRKSLCLLSELSIVCIVGMPLLTTLQSLIGYILGSQEPSPPFSDWVQSNTPRKKTIRKALDPQLFQGHVLQRNAQCKSFILFVSWDDYKIHAVRCVKYLTQAWWIFTSVHICVVIIQTEI